MGQAVDVPPHLRELVVQQDYERYDEIDQAVWRFVVLQAHRRLCETAHPAYARGFTDTGISTECIPRIEQMSEQLSRFGWRAVCVDGFIPPRAFVAFQARGILPIAADIRTLAHLTYTPAPDIIHEAAGHAPLLAEPSYGAFIREIGKASERAFANPRDAAFYRAIYTLSEVKEDPASTPEQVARAEQAVRVAHASLGAPSEAARMARLYWWTAEYGLVGTPESYRLYGAGLLSSLGEGHFCHDPAVRKLPLTAECVQTDYDITQAQPQLFVAPSFDALFDVLGEVADTLVHRRGGAAALAAALQSEELVTLTFDSGLQVSGVLHAIHGSPEAPEALELTGRCGLGRDDAVLPYSIVDDGLLVALGSPELGRASARLARTVTAPGERVRSAWPGALDGFLPKTAFSPMRVPKPRTLGAAQHELLGLYEQAMEAWRDRAGTDVVPVFERLARELDRRHPEEWLLRWNLLESLVKLGQGEQLASRLREELERLEIRYLHREPIATGLRYLLALAGERKVA
jgi:phenylalanine-4-hydroxylase